MSSLALQDQWSEKIVAWRDSDLSVAAWCREYSEGYHRFLYWRKRLAPEQQVIGRFVEVKIAIPPLALSCNGVYVHVASGFDTELLSGVLSVLKRV